MSLIFLSLKTFKLSKTYTSNIVLDTNLISFSYPQNEKQTREEQKKLTNLLEKILAAFEQSATVSNRIAETSEEDEESLPKKIGDLTDTVRELRREIGEMRADQDTMEVEPSSIFLFFFLN